MDGETLGAEVLLCGAMVQAIHDVPGAHVVWPWRSIERPARAANWVAEAAWAEQTEMFPCRTPDEQMNGELDVLFMLVDGLLRRGDYEECDRVLPAFDAATLQPDAIVGILSATWPARDRLPSRAAFVLGVEARLRELAIEDVDGLLQGLR